MVSNQTSASTKFYMNQANKIVDVLSEIVPTIYYDVFKDDFNIFMYGLWNKPDDTHPPILEQSVLHVGESIQTLEQTNWNALSKEKQIEWLKRLDLQALLKSLRFRDISLDYFCEKNSLVKSKMTNVLQSMINWRNYGVGHKSVYKYEQMDESIFKLNILEPVWDFYDLLSRKYQVECEILRKTLREIEMRMKYPSTNVERLSKMSHKSEQTVRSTLETLKIYVDAEGNIKGEIEENLVTNIKRLAKKEVKKESKQEQKQKNVEISKKRNSKTKMVLSITACAVIFIIAIILGISTFNNSRFTKVPNVVRASVNKAKDLLEENDLKVKVKYIDKLGETKGIVLSQSEKSNKKVKKDQTVVIEVCSGLVKVPNVKGKNIKEASKILKKSHLEAVKKEIFSEKIKKGIVMSQSVKDGDKADENSKIKVIVSKGKDRIVIPNIEGKSYKEAKNIIKQKGLKTKKVKEYSSYISRNKIISTSPSAGKKVKRGAEISIVVSKGENPNSVRSSNSYSSSSISSNNNRVTKHKKNTSSNKQKKNIKKDHVDSWDTIN